ncbi:uncharacterized protein SCHCODRAFT_02574435 [Schizophyllum commune H4-8]|nr:uncharacterized protein SCHCODRAFT_02574435 [Schizophyllum commune H4-8]KAI5893201.1 hypothetical protein SCHCODRAFT_02574435 [Schizophyllum commune H4-8]
MHLALRILDIQLAIFDLLSQKRDLLSAILVCKDWQDAAERLLWKELPDLIPLLMLMPNDAWHVNKMHRSNLLPYSFVFTRQISEDDWFHVYRRAHLVRRITFELLSHPPSLIDRVARCPPRQPLFLQVDKLIFRATSDSLHTRPIPARFLDIFYNSGAIIDLVCYNISSFSLPDPHRLRALGKVIIRWVPNHAESGLGDEASCLAHAMSLIDALIACQPASLSLTLSQTRFSASLIKRLYQCKPLRELTLEFDDSYDDSHCSVPCPAKASLPNLHSLTIREAETATCTAAAIVGACTTLALLDVDFRNHGTGRHLMDLTTTIHSNCNAATLRDVTICWEAWALHLAHLAPLTTAMNLEKLFLLGEGGAKSALTDADYENLVSHWPRLQTLCIEVQKAVGRCTLATLGILAQCCHNIERIELPLTDATVPDPQMTWSDTLPSPGPAKASGPAVQITFHVATETDTETMATFLLRLFPRLEEVDPGWMLDDINGRQRWYEVGKRIKEMQRRSSAMDGQDHGHPP